MSGDTGRSNPAELGHVRITAAFDGVSIRHATGAASPLYPSADPKCQAVVEGTPVFTKGTTSGRNANVVEIIAALNGFGSSAAGINALRSELAFVGVAAYEANYNPNGSAKNVVAVVCRGLIPAPLSPGVNPHPSDLAVIEFPRVETARAGRPALATFRPLRQSDLLSISHFQDCRRYVTGGATGEAPEALTVFREASRSVREIMFFGALLNAAAATTATLDDFYRNPLSKKEVEDIALRFGFGGKDADPLIAQATLMMLAPDKDADPKFTSGQAHQTLINNVVNNAVRRALIVGTTLASTMLSRVVGKFTGGRDANGRADVFLSGNGV